MGDRCWIEIFSDRKGAEILNKIIVGDSFSFEPTDQWPGTLRYEDDQCNYSALTERTQAAEAGATFWGQYGPGSDYTAGLFAAFGGKHVEVEAIDGYAGARIGNDGNPIPRDMENIAEFLLVLQRAKEDVGQSKIPAGQDNPELECVQLAALVHKLRNALDGFCEAIEAAGGVFRDNGAWGCEGDPEWVDLAHAYMDACTAINRVPKFNRVPKAIVR